MRASGVIRFVVLGAVGFGMGWAAAGLFNVALVAVTDPMVGPGSPPPGWVTWPPYFAYLFAGGLGGAALGLATGSWKRVITLAVAGGVGLGLSLILLFVVAFLFGVGSISIAIGVGLSGGVALGLIFWDWKRVVLLGLAGLVGFGAGGVIVAAWGMPLVLYPFFVDFVELWRTPPLLLEHLLAQAMIGLIGGASLGATLGYLEHRKLVAEREPRVR